MNKRRAGIGCSEIRRTNVDAINSEPILGLMEDGDLPEWLLLELLIRLPVKLIFRLKLVCKHWLSLISDPSFVRLYISRVSLLQPMQSRVFVSHMMSLDRSKHSNFLESVKRPNLLVPTQQPYQLRFRIHGISNGLVLCAKTVPQIDEGSTGEFNICNPVTGQWITLPPVTCKLKKVHSGFLTRVEDGMLKSYRVVCLELSSLRTKTPKSHVFDSESGKWKDFSVSSDSVPSDLEVVKHRLPFDLHGNLHWELSKKRILAYDPCLKPNELRIMKLPRNNDQEYYQPRKIGFSSLCGVSDGKLRFLDLVGLNDKYDQFSYCEIWILNDYSSGDWSLQGRISHNDIIYDPIHCSLQKCMLPISFDPVDSDVVYLGYFDVLFSFNIKTKKLKAHHDHPRVIGECRYYDYWYPFMWSLMFLIPPWPTSMPTPSF